MQYFKIQDVSLMYTQAIDHHGWCCLIPILNRKRERDFSLIERRPPLCCTLFPDFTLDFNFHHIWTLKGPFVQRENNAETEEDSE